MRVELTGLKSLRVARLFSSLYYLCRMNPLIVERDFDKFMEKVLDNVMVYDYTQDDLEAIFSCIDDPDKNGIQPIDKISILPLETVIECIKNVFKELLHINIIKDTDLWEGYPLNEAIDILIKKNPNFSIKQLLEMTQE